MTRKIEGRCLCGACTVTAEVDKPVLRACHCDMCQRLTSVAFVSIKIDVGEAVFQGPTRSYRSSEWAARGFCDTCGSTLWYENISSGVKNPAAGLFHNAGDAALNVEFFADNCPNGFAFAGEHKKLSTSETVALFTERTA